MSLIEANNRKKYFIQKLYNKYEVELISRKRIFLLNYIYELCLAKNSYPRTDYVGFEIYRDNRIKLVDAYQGTLAVEYYIRDPKDIIETFNNHKGVIPPIFKIDGVANFTSDEQKLLDEIYLNFGRCDIKMLEDSIVSFVCDLKDNVKKESCIKNERDEFSKRNVYTIFKIPDEYKPSQDIIYNYNNVYKFVSKSKIKYVDPIITGLCWVFESLTADEQKEFMSLARISKVDELLIKYYKLSLSKKEEFIKKANEVKKYSDNNKNINMKNVEPTMDETRKSGRKRLFKKIKIINKA